MKTFVYLALIITVASFGYNLWAMNFTESFFGDINRPYVVGISAGVCALFVCVILLKYHRLKQNLEVRSKSA